MILLAGANAALGVTLAELWSGEFAQAQRRKKIAIGVLLGAGLAVDAGFVWLLAHRGNLQKVLAWRPPQATLPVPLAAEDPNARGPYTICLPAGATRR